MTTTVTALLVSHDGDRWLPVVLDALGDQTRRPDAVLAVDAASTDTGPALLQDRLGAGCVLALTSAHGYGDAVAAGLAALPSAAEDEWVWLLHDDSAPAPDALERLLAAAEDHPSVPLLGPKVREWPSLRRLLEVGVTIGGTGRRETGLERGEYDQGQHDRVRDVLAVNTAGLLVRRPVLEDLGLDPRLPVLGTDLDLGWRAARAGHRTVVVPDAVVFHAEAAGNGHRSGVPRPRRTARSAALYVLLVNASPLALPVQAVRLLLGSLLRAAGLLLVRAPREAADELAAVAALYLRPGPVLAGRRQRRGRARAHARDVRHLLAPWWLPYRHGLDAVGDLLSALALEVGDRGRGRRSFARLAASPAAPVLVLLVLAALVTARPLLGRGVLSGGALLPAPDSALHWWSLYLQGHHDLATGSAAPAAPYVLPLAVVGTLLLAKAWLLVDLLFLLAVPLAATGAYRFLRGLRCGRPAALWGAVAYGVLPVVSGAVQQGRLGTVVATLLLPWLAGSATYLGPGGDADRRARAAWRTTLWLALLTAFVPLAWPVAVVLAMAAAGAAGPDRRALGRLLLAPVLGALVLLVPWSLTTWGHQDLGSALLEAGLPLPAGPLSRWDVLAGRPGAGAPGWLSLGVLLAAVAALVRPDTRPAVLRAWAVVVVALAAAAALAATVSGPSWLGFVLVLAQGAAVTAAALAGSGIRGRLSRASFTWRQPVGGVVVVLALAGPALSVLWWVWAGSGGPLGRIVPTEVPAYMTDAAAADPANGVLVVRGSRERGFTHALLRQPGIRLGDDTVLPSAADQAPLTRAVSALATAPVPADVATLSRLGVAYVYLPAPVDAALVGNLDSLGGLAPGSALRPGARAWRLEAPPGRASLAGAGAGSRPWLLALQGVALVVVGVLAVPSRRVPR